MLQNVPIHDYSLSAFQSDPLGFIENLTAQYGEVIPYKVGGENVIMVNDPEWIKYVLVSKNRFYIKEGTPEIYMLRPVLGNGMLTSDGEAWSAQRSTAKEAFSRESVARFIDIMYQETEKMLQNWQSNTVIEIEAEMSKLTLQIVGKCLFGSDLSRYADEFSENVKIINKHLGHYDPLDYASFKGFTQALAGLRNFVDIIIDERIAAKKNEIEDFLDLLIHIQSHSPELYKSHLDLIDQVFTFLMAGHETTAKALTWTLYELAKHPECRERAENECKTVLKNQPPTLMLLHALPYTWQVLQESMRLNPPVWVMSRLAAEDDTIKGYPIKKGTMVLVSPYLIHRHSGYWTEPLQFNPERFAPEAAAIQPDFTFLPYSVGPRRCIGMNFANQELMVILSMILQRFRLSLREGFTVEHEALVTLRPKFGMEMQVFENI